MAKKSYSKDKIIIIVIIISLIVLLFCIFTIQRIVPSRVSKISESQSRQLAQKYFGDGNPGSELKKLYDLDGGWCYGMLPTNGEESTGGVMLCVDDRGQGYEILSYMNYPKDGESIYDYISSLEQENSTNPSIKIDL